MKQTLASVIFLMSTFVAFAVERVDSVVCLSSEETKDTVMLQEINVSSIKQTSRLFQIPEAASLINAREAERLGAVTIKSLSDVVPNFFIPDYGSRITSSIYVRGIGARMDQPAVGLNVDNVPVLNKDAYDFDIADIASVEMLRGPQTALYGRNTMAGQINISTLSPFRWQGWRIRAEFVSPLSLRAALGWYHRFDNRHALSLNLSGLWSRGIFTNEYNGKKADPEYSGALRAKYIWRLSDRVTLQNVAAVSLLRQGGYAYENVQTGRIAYNDTCFYRRFLFTDGLTLSWFSDRFSLSSVTSFQYIDDNMTLDQDFLPLDYFTLTQKKHEPTVTQDLVVKSLNNGSVYSWLAGAFFFYKGLKMEAPVTFLDYGISRLIEDHRNQGNPGHPIAWDSRSFPLISDFSNPAWGAAIYHKSDLHLGRWEISMALRLDYEKVNLRYHSLCSTGYSVFDLTPEGGMINPRHAVIEIDDRGRHSSQFVNFIPKFTLLYNLPLQDDANLYLNVAKGYKSGGYNTQMFSDVLQQRLMMLMGIGATYDIDKMVAYRPEHSWNFEIGSHLSFFDGRLSGDLSLFYIDCRDQQLTMFPSGTTTGRMMTNAGKTRSFGFEIQINAVPVEHLALRASYGFTDARFRYFNDGRNDYSGKYLPYAPRNTLFMQAVYTWPLKRKHIRSIEFDLNLRATGKIYWNESNTLSQPIYFLPGASVALTGSDWEIRLFGTNLSDARYYTFYFQSIGNEFRQRGRPIQGGISFMVNI